MLGGVFLRWEELTRKIRNREEDQTRYNDFRVVAKSPDIFLD
jgi:ATP-dependent helicase/DNAse subunit B